VANRVSQVALEVLVKPYATVRVTHLEASAWVAGAPGLARVTHLEPSFGGTGEPGAVRVTHLYVYVLGEICSDTAGRIITTPLNDTTLRPQFIGHKVTVERTDDPYTVTEGNATWTVEASGYATRATLADALTWEFSVGDVDRVERDTELFAGPEVVAGEPSCLIGGPVTGGFGDLIDYGLPVYRVASVEAGEFLTLQYTSGPYTPRDHINALAPQFLSRVSDYEAFGRGYIYPTLVVELYDPTTGDLVNTGTGTVRGEAGEFTPISLRSPVRPRGYNIGPGGVLMPGRLNERLVTSSDAITIDWADSQPTVGTRYKVRMYASRATETTPFHFDGHPVDFATAIYDALGIVYDSSTATTTKEALGPDFRVLLRPTAPEKALDVLEKWLYGPVGFAYRVVEGVREFYLTRQRSSSTPATTITIADLRGEGTPYEVSDRGILSRVAWEEQKFQFWELDARDADDVSQDTLAGLAIDGLEAKDSTTVFTQDDSNAPPYQGEQAYRYPGFIVEPLETVAGEDATFKAHTAAELFYRWGRGTVEVRFPMLPTFTAEIGDFLVNEVDYSPIPEANETPITVRPKDYPGRTPRQVLQLVKRSEGIDGPDCTFLVVGPVAADVETAKGTLTLPTLSIAAEASQPKNAARITVTNWGTVGALSTNRVDIQYNTGASSPSTWNMLTTLMPALIATGRTATPVVEAGSKVWARARTWNLDGRFSSWSTPVSVVLTGLTAPSGLAAAVTGTTSEVTFTWTNGEATEPVVLRYQESGSSVWVEMATLPAGTTRYVYAFPDASTTYTVEVFHRQALPIVSESAADDVTFSTGASTPALTAPQSPAASSANGTVTLCVTVGDVLATRTVFEIAPEESDGSFTAWEVFASLAVGADRVCASTSVAYQTSPFVGTRARYYRVRAHHEATGYTDSADTTAITTDPWAITTPPPPIEGGTYSEGDLLVADAAGTLVPLAIGANNEVLVSDGTTATWDTAPGSGALDDLTDVDAAAPNDGDVLTYDSGTGDWVPVAPSAGGALDDLTDVDAAAPSDGDVLTFDSGSGDWMPVAPTTGSGGWTQEVTESGGSLANWNSNAGTWATSGGEITQTDTSTQRRITYLGAIVPYAALVYEADMQIVSGSGTDQVLGLLIGKTNANEDNAFLARLKYNGTSAWQAQVENDSVGNNSAVGITAVGVGTWATLRVLVMGTTMSVWVDGVHVLNGVVNRGRSGNYLGLFTGSVSAKFRNIAAWTLDLP